MAIILPSGFNITSTDPVDARFTVTNQAARYGLATANIYPGLLVYQQDVSQTYILVDTTNVINSDGWQVVITGGSSVSGSQTISGSVTVLGSITGSLFGTASQAISASYAPGSDTAVSASYALTASYALNVPTQSISSSYATSASYANIAVSASIAETASYTLNAISASRATSAANADTASYVDAANVHGLNLSQISSGSVTASISPDLGFTVNTNTQITGSLSISSSASTLKIEGNGFSQTYLSTNGALVLNPGYGGVGMAGTDQYMTLGYVVGQSAGTQLTGSFSGSFIGLLQGTASNAVSSSYALSASYAPGSDTSVTSSYALTASYVQDAVSSSYALTASYALNIPTQSVTSSYALTASYVETSQTASFVVSSSYALSASYAPGSDTSVTSSYALTASYVETSQTASFVVSASYALSASYAPGSDTSVTSSYALTASYVENAQTASLASNTILLDGRNSSTFANTGSNTFTGPQYVSDNSNAISFTSTASLYTDGGARVTKDLYVSGTTYLNNLTVFGSASVQFVTTSVLVGLEFINLNTDLPALRYAGINVGDSGSAAGISSSFWYDSEKDNWLYVHAHYGASETSSLAINGPITYNNLGNEQGLTANYITKAQLVSPDNSHHITSSQIYDDGTTVSILGNLTVTGSTLGTFTGSLLGTSSYTLTASYVETSQTASYVVSSSYALSASYAPGSDTSVTASYALTASYVETSQTASYVVSSSYALSASYAPGSDTSVTASYALTASYVENAQTASYVLQAVSSSYALSASYAPGSGTSTSASYADTASYINPLNQDVQVTGSFNLNSVSASFQIIGNGFGQAYLQNAVGAIVLNPGYGGVEVVGTNAVLKVNGNVNTVGTLTVNQAFVNNATVTSSINGSNIVISQVTGSYSSAFFQYTATSGSNARAGQVSSVWNEATTSYTDYSTTDIGLTAAVTASVTLSGDTLQFTVQTNTAGWKIKTLATYL